MRHLYTVKRTTFTYFILAIAFSALLFAPLVELQFFGVGAAVVSMAFGIEGVFQYWRMVSNEQDREHRHLEAITPDVQQHRAQAEMFRALGDYVKMVKSLNDQQLALYSFLFPDLLFEGVKESHERYYTEKEAQLVIFQWSEHKHGFVHLPSQWDVGSGTRVQKVIQNVSNDLIDVGAARRDKKNTRAYLTVSQEEAMDLLYQREVSDV